MRAVVVVLASSEDSTLFLSNLRQKLSIIIIALNPRTRGSPVPNSENLCRFLHWSTRIPYARFIVGTEAQGQGQGITKEIDTMKKIFLVAFAAMTVLTASTKAPKAPKNGPIPQCFPCPPEISAGN